MAPSRRTWVIPALLINIWILALVQSVNAADPLYYGFFFDEKIAASITKASQAYLKNVNSSSIPEIEDFLKEISEASGVNDTLKYYEKPKDPLTQKDDKEYHVTAKYCGENGKEECAQYAKTFEKHLNKKFQMELVGFVFTNRTFGIRIKLVGDQCQLLQNTTSCPEPKSAETTSPELPGLKLDPVEDWGTFPITETQAHITLGCAPGVPAVTTGPDMILAIEFEQGVNDADEESMTSWDNAVDPFVGGENNNMTVTRYNSTTETTDMVFVIYPRMRIVAEATFKAFPHSGGSSIMSSVISGSGSATLSLLVLFSQLYLHKYF